ncbi:MAG: FKBP-type peptidyl-prolyl cis-trans isomerase SlyD [Myxococcota bacterium]|jgi:FKBP-type peptidyl-prolyl cis-trans isomerase SlyD
MSETVTAGKVVLMHYTLRNGQGDVLDTSDGRPPMPYLHGAQNIVPGLEQQLDGVALGAKVSAVVEPKDAYGVRNEDAMMVLPRTAFPDDMPLEPGTPFAMHDPNDQNRTVHAFVVAIKEEQVMIDANHPLAGVTLHFDVEIVGLRDATEEERTHGHPHGADGTGGHSHDH